jgi:acyl-CoA reductase-like NAD-dependent aldehyde dehydrogenase
MSTRRTRLTTPAERGRLLRAPAILLDDAREEFARLERASTS